MPEKLTPTEIQIKLRLIKAGADQSFVDQEGIEINWYVWDTFAQVCLLGLTTEEITATILGWVAQHTQETELLAQAKETLAKAMYDDAAFTAAQELFGGELVTLEKGLEEKLMALAKRVVAASIEKFPEVEDAELFIILEALFDQAPISEDQQERYSEEIDRIIQGTRQSS